MLFILERRKYLSELSPLINKKDVRSIRKWCAKNQVPLYEDSSGSFVNETEFEIAYNMPIILKLKNQYGEGWQKYYDLYQSGKLYDMLSVNDGVNNKKTNYKPKGKLSVKIFEESRK